VGKNEVNEQERCLSTSCHLKICTRRDTQPEGERETLPPVTWDL